MKREKKNAKQVKTITWKSLKPLPPEEVDEMFPVAKLIGNSCESDTQQVLVCPKNCDYLLQAFLHFFL